VEERGTLRVTADLNHTGKVMGGGLPAPLMVGAAKYGRIAPLAGLSAPERMSGNPLAMAAGPLRRSRFLRRGCIRRSPRRTARLAEGLKESPRPRCAIVTGHAGRCGKCFSPTVRCSTSTTQIGVTTAMSADFFTRRSSGGLSRRRQHLRSGVHLCRTPAKQKCEALDRLESAMRAAHDKTALVTFIGALACASTLSRRHRRRIIDQGDQPVRIALATAASSATLGGTGTLAIYQSHNHQDGCERKCERTMRVEARGAQLIVVKPDGIGNVAGVLLHFVSNASPESFVTYGGKKYRGEISSPERWRPAA